MSAGKDRILLPPTSAKRSNLICHFCIVGCGYHVYKWPENEEGGRAPYENALGLDFRKQLPPKAVIMTRAMENVVTDRDGKRYNILIVPDKECEVNKGLSSTRGGMMASYMYNSEGITRERLTKPRFLLRDKWLDTSWENALGLYVGLTKKILDEDGPEQLAFNCFDHGGAGGGFENTWATGKLMFSALRTPMVRTHNRPAYTSECQATHDAGIFELNNSYEDAQLADVIMAVGANQYETQTNYFLIHWLPNLLGQTEDKKRQRFPGETVGPARIILVDPRRTVSLSVIEAVVGKDQVLHLEINPGTDTALFNGLFTYVVEQGWIDRDFIARNTTGFDEAVKANRMSLEEASRITGVGVDKIKQAAQWAYQPKHSGQLPRTLHSFEKGAIWGNDNYRIQAALINLVLATRNVGRRGTGAVRLGGHQEGYCRPPYPPGRTPVDVDAEIIAGHCKMLTFWGCNTFQTAPNAEEYRETIHRRSAIVKMALVKARGASVQEKVDLIYEAVTKNGGLFVTVIDLYPTMVSENAAHLMLPAAHAGEMNLTSMNGERRLRLTEKFMDPPGVAKADFLIAADIANALKRQYEQEGKLEMARRFAGFDWKNEEDAFNDGFRRAGQPGGEDIVSQGGSTGHLATYVRLREAGNNGVQLPIRALENDRLVGTEMLYQDGRFDTADGRARFLPAPWAGMPEKTEAQRRKYRFWINNGRINEVWQTAYHNKYDPFVRGRYPMAVIEMNPEDARELDIASGDIVEVYNDYGSTHALAYLDHDIKTGHTFMQFGHYNGIVGDVVTDWEDRNHIPYYKGTWANVRRIGGAEESRGQISFKRRRYDNV
jgi:arsenite oxidase large subunit